MREALEYPALGDAGGEGVVAELARFDKRKGHGMENLLGD